MSDKLRRELGFYFVMVGIALIVGGGIRVDSNGDGWGLFVLIAGILMHVIGIALSWRNDGYTNY